MLQCFKETTFYETKSLVKQVPQLSKISAKKTKLRFQRILRRLQLYKGKPGSKIGEGLGKN
ncbi:hypothetical protein BIW11_08978 [Tropilaelaps mercedesae]|uniref:Uncharacterized protein n=1 Tax=Tropilaelaps mercedesae TaxID=418985 RepID=A0A1V9XM34_9ACAR|nr:hypothetical protein BIW11_08978 [Tropilaelaps mercedesae]